MNNTALLTIGAVLIASLLTPRAAAQDDVFVDVDRSNRAQRAAADKAKEELRSDGIHRRPDRIEAILTDVSGQVRDAAVDEIVKSWSDEQLSALRSFVLRKPRKKKPDLAGEAAVEILGRRKHSASVKALVDALRSKVPPYRSQLAAWALREIGDTSKLADIRKAFDKAKHPRVKAEILHTLVELEHPESEDLVREVLEDPEVIPLALIALELMAERYAPATLAPIASMLDNEEVELPEATPLLSRAFEILLQVDDPAGHPGGMREVVGALIGKLPELSGRIQWEAFDVLHSITLQKDLGTDIRSWQDWWKAQRGEWKPPREKSKAGKGHTSVKVEYHGIPVDSLNLTFISDISGGMGRNAQGEFDGPGPTRLDMTKKELARVLGLLDKKTLANLLYFGSYYHEASKQPIPVGRGRKKLIEYNHKRKIPEKPGHNRGNVFDALVHVVEQPSVDTIYLLTEGAPTEGKFQNFERFAFHFQRLNRFRRVRVHVLSIGNARGRNRTFLEKLAKDSGGTFKQLPFK